MEEKTREVSLETIKIQDQDLNASQILEKFTDILEYFAQSPRTTPDLEKLNRFIDMLWKRKHFEQALTAVEDGVQKYPGDRGLVEKMGEIFIDWEKYEEAKEIFQSLIELYPDRSLYYYCMGIIHSQFKEFAEAEKAFLKSLTGSDGDAGFQMTRFDIVEKIARLYYEKEDYPKALEFMEQILTIHPRSSKWRLYFKILEKAGMTSELESATVTYEQIKKARRYQSRALKYEIQGRLESALNNYKKAIELNAYEPQYFFSVANILEKLPEDEYEYQFEEATNYYRTAVELYPGNLFYVLALIGNLTTTRDWDEAFEIAAKTGEKYPELMLPSLRHLSFILGKEPDYIALLRKFIDNDTGKRHTELRSELGILLKERRDEEAEKWFREAAEMYIKKMEYEPYQWRSYWDFANCLLELGNLESAAENFEKAMNLYGEFSTDIAEKLVEAYFSMDEYGKVRKYLIHLIKLFPEDYEYTGKLGMCFLHDLEYKQAFEAFNCSLSLNRYIPEYLYGAAVSAARLGYTDDAINIIKDLLEMEPHFQEIIELEDAFLEVKETRKFLDMLTAHEARQTQPPPVKGIKLKKFMMPTGIKDSNATISDKTEDQKTVMQTAAVDEPAKKLTETDGELEDFFRKLDDEGVKE